MLILHARDAVGYLNNAGPSEGNARGARVEGEPPMKPEVRARRRAVVNPAPSLESLEPRQLLHAFSAAINFQPAAAAVPPGYMVDAGQAYGDRGDGVLYGWTATNTANARDRNVAADQRLDTLVQMQAGGSYAWEIAVPDGDYAVKVVAGDAAFFDSVYRINVEGVLTVDGTPISGSRWVTGTKTVTVADGRLTVSNATGAKNNKLAYVEITAAHATSDPEPVPQPATPAGGTFAWSNIASGPVARANAQSAVVGGRVYLFGGLTNSAGQATVRGDVYNPATNAWTRLADLPQPLTAAATVVNGNDVWLIGGFLGNSTGPSVKSVWKYNVSTNAWSKGPDLPQDVGGTTAQVIGGRIYVTGGLRRGAGGALLGDVAATRVLDLSNLSAGWQTRANLPNPRNHPASAVAKGVLYVFGGQHGVDPNARQTDVHAYNPATNAWSKVGSMPFARSHFGTSSFAFNDRVYLFGGSANGDAATGRSLAFDPATKVWTYLQPLPEARSGAAAALVNGSLYLLGGGVTVNGATAPTAKSTKTLFVNAWERLANVPISLGEVATAVIGNKMYLVGEESGSTLEYDLTNNTWKTTLAKRPFLGDHHASEVVNGKWYLIGGMKGAGGRVQIYNPATNTWSTGASMPFDAGSTNTAVINGKIYAAGGIIGNRVGDWAGTATTDRAAVYDPATDQWTEIAKMPRGVNHAAAATDGRKLYVFGGRGGQNVPSNGFDTVQVYDPATNKWTSSLTGAFARLPQARGGMGKAVFAHGEFYVIGGETSTGAGATSNKVYTRVDIYSPLTNTWRRGPDLPTARHGIFPVLHAGRIYIAAGGVKAGGSSSAVFEVLTLA